MARDAERIGASQKSQRETVNFVGSKRTSLSSKIKGVDGKKITCYCCGREIYRSTVCKYKHLKSNLCKKQGHLARVCKVNKENKGKLSQANKVP